MFGCNMQLPQQRVYGVPFASHRKQAKCILNISLARALLQVSVQISPFFLLSYDRVAQEKYYNAPTYRLSRASITGDFANLAATVVGENSLPALKSGFNDSQTDNAARISFKYGCSRGVTGTPFFFVNGMPLQDSGEPLDYKKWRSILDQLLGNKTVEGENV
ncbi:hypothetical protein ACMD2_13718 [Ananas comosus]|uniref:Thioredoxin-like fold domain-containing protein n=1 Tax=Ananas comosus TaxID=4615 RepID=A0A199V0R3_ANACO|nr:hypothetical protein ACMD2_13718 [Ananas comosus]